MTQKKTVLEHLKHGSITQKTAIDRYRIYRLADVIFKLRGEGHNIATEPVTVKTQYRNSRFARYHLVIPERQTSN